MAAKPYAELAERIIAIVDWETLGIPPRHKETPTFRAMAKGISFTSERSLETMYSAVADLCIYGFTDRAAQVGLALSEVVSGTPRVPYMYVSTAVYLAAVFADLDEHPDADTLKDLALNPPGEHRSRGSRALDGSMLRMMDQPSEGMHLSVYAGLAAQDIFVLTDMYLLGSPTWTRPQIVAELKRSIARIHRTPGYEPWIEDATPTWGIPHEPSDTPKKHWWKRRRS